MTDRKRRRRKEARPDEIIAAALMEFEEQGYAATSIGSIAARAEIARSTVYLYFEDKDALIRQAFEDRIGSVFDNAQVTMGQADTTFETAFRGMLGLVYARIAAPETLVLLRILIAEGRRYPELTAYYHDEILQRAHGMLSRMIAGGIARGELRPEIAGYDPKLLIAPVILSGLWTLVFNEIDPIDLPRFIDGHVDIVMRGIAARA